MTDRPEEPGLPGGEPPMAPHPPPPAHVAPGTVGLESETPVRTGGLTGVGGRVAAGVLGLVLLVGGVAFAATQMGNDDGASDPEAAVADMFDAIADEDVLGLLATLDPGERDALTGPVEELFSELERLEVLDESFELDGVSGVDLEFDGLTFRQEPVRADLVRVYLTGGTASFAVDTDAIPVGDFVTDTFERFGVEYRGIQQSDSEALDPAEADDTFVVVRNTGDGWRVSLGYTAVEAARMRAGAQVPVAGAGLTAIGADSPEAAVEGFLRAVIGIDVEGAVARLSPGELRAVHDYWPALVGGADLPTAADVPAEMDLTDLELRSTTDGDRGQVFVDSIGIDVVTEDFEGGATISDGCITMRGDVRTALEEAELGLADGPICQDDIEAILEEAAGETGGFGLFGLGGLDTLAFEGGGDTPELGITVVRIDGDWYVAPLGTWADLGLAVLETLEREDLDAMVDSIEELVGSFGGGMLGGGFLPPGMDELENIEDFQTDVFEDVGEPVPDGQLSQPGTEATDIDAILAEIVDYFADDRDMAECAVAELYATARTDQLTELADAYRYDFEPSPEAQDVLFTALAACGW
jgi:hypothetical protein